MGTKNLLVFFAAGAYLQQSGGNTPKSTLASITLGISSPRLQAFGVNETGYVERFRLPSPNLSSISTGIAISPNQSVILCSRNTTDPDTILAYKWDELGFGDKYPDPAVFPVGSVGVSCGFHPSGDYTFSSHWDNTSNDGIFFYEWDDVTGFGAQTDRISVGGNRFRGAFSESGSTFFVGVSTLSGQRVMAYPFNAGLVGTMFPAPADDVTGGVNQIITKGNGVVAVAGGFTERLAALKFIPGVGFDTRYNNPTPAPVGAGWDLAFNKAGNAVVVITKTFPHLYAYEWDDATGFGAAYADPVSVGGLMDSWTSDENPGIEFNLDDSLLFFGDQCMAWDNTTGFGAVLTPSSNFADTGGCRGLVLASLAPDFGNNGGVWETDKPFLFQSSDGTTEVTTVGDPVGYIADQKVSQSHLINSTPVEKPTYQEDAGLPFVQFDGTDDYLLASLPSEVKLHETGYTFGLAARVRDIGTANKYLMSLAKAGATSPFIAIKANGGIFEPWSVNLAGDSESPGTASFGDSNKHVFVLRLTGGTLEFFIDGVLESLENVSGEYPIDQVGVGALTRDTVINYADLDLYDSFMVARSMSDLERQTKEAELAESAGITL